MGATGQTNVLQQLAYGTELPVCEQTGEWSKVKVNNQEGYVYNKYLLNKRSFYKLNSIFADTTSRNGALETRAGGHYPVISEATTSWGKWNRRYKHSFLESAAEKRVAVICKRKNVKPNTVYYKKIVSQQSKFEDFAFVIY